MGPSPLAPGPSRPGRPLGSLGSPVRVHEVDWLHGFDHEVGQVVLFEPVSHRRLEQVGPSPSTAKKLQAMHVLATARIQPAENHARLNGDFWGTLTCVQQPCPTCILSETSQEV